MKTEANSSSYHHVQSILYESQGDTTHIKHWESRIQQETYTSHFHENHIDISDRSTFIRIFSILICQYKSPMTAIVLLLAYVILFFIAYLLH